MLYERWGHEWWFGPNFYTYIKVFSGTDIPALQEKFSAFDSYEVLTRQGYRLEFPLDPINRVHIYSHITKEFEPGGSPIIIYALIIVAGLVLVLAWVNYVNLTTVQAMERAKEVGLRKVIGARKRDLIQQFLLHTLLVNGFSACLVIGMLEFVLPVFNQYLNTNLNLVLYQDGIPHSSLFWLLFLMVYLVGVFLSGMYPAFVLSSFRPVVALQGKILKQRRFMGTSLRNSLMVFQFAISILLMIGTLAVFQQTQYMQSQQLGFDMEKMVVIENPLGEDTTMIAEMNVFKDEVTSHTSFNAATLSSAIPGIPEFWTYAREGSEDFFMYTNILADANFLDCYDIELIAGRWFREGMPNDDRNMVINEVALQMLGFASPEDALQAKIKELNHAKNTRTIIGVIKKHHQSSLHTAADPVVFLLNTAKFFVSSPDGQLGEYTYPSQDKFISIKIAKERSLSEAMDALETLWDKNFSGIPMHYFFLDERYNQQYQSEALFQKVFGLFSGLAIFIACLGLLGFIAYSVRQRTKEIGIRKVLGASVSHILVLLSKGYIKLILVACVVALPIAYFLIQRWLEGFAYKTDLLWWLFAAPGAMVLAIALLSISGQAIRAALANPVDSLRNE